MLRSNGDRVKFVDLKLKGESYVASIVYKWLLMKGIKINATT